MSKINKKPIEDVLSARERWSIAREKWGEAEKEMKQAGEDEETAKKNFFIENEEFIALTMSTRFVFVVNGQPQLVTVDKGPRGGEFGLSISDVTIV